VATVPFRFHIHMLFLLQSPSIQQQERLTAIPLDSPYPRLRRLRALGPPRHLRRHTVRVTMVMRSTVRRDILQLASIHPSQAQMGTSPVAMVQCRDRAASLETGYDDIYDFPLSICEYFISLFLRNTLLFCSGCYQEDTLLLHATIPYIPFTIATTPVLMTVEPRPLYNRTIVELPVLHRAPERGSKCAHRYFQWSAVPTITAKDRIDVMHGKAALSQSTHGLGYCREIIRCG